jgi:prepilin-type processing-associated H-X9-DG protein
MTTLLARGLNPRQRRGSPAGFTLTELLVVLATVILLALTAAPALSRARPKSQLARCASNMRLWGTATAMYLGDHNDRLPYFGNSSSDYTGLFWHGLLAPYVPRVAEPGGAFSSQQQVTYVVTDIFTNVVRKCPAGSYTAPEYYQGNWDGRTSGVNGWNCWIGANFGLYSTPLNGPFYYANLSGTFNPPLSVARIKKPADAMIFIDTLTHYVYSPLYTSYKFALDLDSDGKPDSMSPYPSIPFNYARPTVHNGGANVTLMDGHVEWVSFGKLWKVDAAGNVVHSFWYLED